MKRKRKCVKVTWRIQDGRQVLHDCVGSLLEHLRYAGLLRVAAVDVEEEQAPAEENAYMVLKNTVGRLKIKHVFDILCPKGLNDEVWARQNAERINSFGGDVKAEVVDE